MVDNDRTMIDLIEAVRHQRPVQWWGRVRNLVRGWSESAGGLGIFDLSKKVPGQLVLRRVGKFSTSWFGDQSPTKPSEINDLLAGRFTFIGLTRLFENTLPDWHNADLPLLWDFNLHYFDYLDTIRGAVLQGVLPAEEAQQRVGSWVGDWMKQNPFSVQPAWHPYPLSLRVVNWIKSYYQFPGWFPSETLPNLFLQGLYLERHLEVHLLANHYLENLRALLFLGLFFDGPIADRWARLAISRLRAEVPEEVLPDGAHYEQSAMYHCLVMAHLLDTYVLLSAHGLEKKWLAQALARMADWLAKVLGPQGQIPLFNDAAEGVAPPAELVLAETSRIVGYSSSSERLLPKNNSCDGLYVFSQGPFFCRVANQPMTPVYNPAHSHADNLSYELFVNQQPLVVDSGTSTYQPGTVRNYERSTISHNTVMVGNTGTAVTWGAFRVGRRPNAIGSQLEETDQTVRFVGNCRRPHGTWRRINHQRCVVLVKPALMVVVDRLVAVRNEPVVSWVNLAPGWQAEIHGEWFRLWLDNGLEMFGYPLRCRQLIRSAGEVATHFNQRRSINRLRFEAFPDNPCLFGYVFSMVELSERPRLQENEQGLGLWAEKEICQLFSPSC